MPHPEPDRGAEPIHAAARCCCDWLEIGSAVPMLLEMLLVVRPREVVVAGIARTEVACAGPGRALRLDIQAPSGIDCRRQPAADAVVTKFAAVTRCGRAFGASHGLNLPVPRWIRAAGGGDAPTGDPA